MARDFQARIDRETERLMVGVEALAWGIVHSIFEAEGPAPKAKPERSQRDRKWPVTPAQRRHWKRKLKPKKKAKPMDTPTKPITHAERMVALPLPGELWKRRDGVEPRRVLHVDQTHVIVESPTYKQGTKVKHAEFFRRYKKVDAS